MNNWYDGNGTGGGGGGGGISSLAPFTPPVNSQFIWTHQEPNGNVDTTDSKSIYLFDVGGQGLNYRVQGRVIPIPSSPYSVECAFIPQFSMSQFNKFSFMGMVLYDIITGKLQTFDILRDADGPTFYFRRHQWGDYTFLANIANSDRLYNNITVHWFKITDDGTNRKYYLSVDGRKYNEWLIESLTSPYLVPTHIGYSINNYSGAFLGNGNTQYQIGMRILHWKVN